MSHYQKAYNFYLDYVNNFATVEHMAEYYSMDPREALNMIKLGRELNDSQGELPAQ